MTGLIWFVRVRVEREDQKGGLADNRYTDRDTDTYSGGLEGDMGLLGRVRVLFCKHRATVLRWADGKMFVSCLDCPFDSPGVVMGTDEEIVARMAGTERASGILEA